MKASYIKNSLLKTISLMEQNIDRFVQKPGVDFTRHRSCPFSSVLLCLLAMENASLNRELRRFFQPRKDGSFITKSAFVQQRAKLNDQAFPFLFSSMNGIFPFKKTFKGYHLLACDGSDVNIPPLRSDPSTRVVSNTEGSVYYQFHLNSVYDILEERFSDILVQPRAGYDERKAFVSFLQRNIIPGKCLFIADRGFFSLNVIAHLAGSASSFLLRVQSDGFGNSFLNRFSLPQEEEFDIDLDFSVTRSKKKHYMEHPDQFIYVRRDRPFDLIHPDDRETLLPISLRLVKIVLPGGSDEFLITDLPRRSFPRETLKHLYHLRWSTETAYSHLKYSVALNSFHSVRRDFIMQEIYARVIFYNMAMLLIHSVTLSRRDRKYEFKISVSDTVIILRDFLINRIKNETIEIWLQKNVTDIRPNRTYPRKKHSKRFVPLNHRC